MSQFYSHINEIKKESKTQVIQNDVDSINWQHFQQFPFHQLKYITFQDMKDVSQFKEKNINYIYNTNNQKHGMSVWNISQW